VQPNHIGSEDFIDRCNLSLLFSSVSYILRIDCVREIGLYDSSFFLSLPAFAKRVIVTFCQELGVVLCVHTAVKRVSRQSYIDSCAYLYAS